jgi:hypothetical protein
LTTAAAAFHMRCPRRPTHLEVLPGYQHRRVLLPKQAPVHAALLQPRERRLPVNLLRCRAAAAAPAGFLGRRAHCRAASGLGGRRVGPPRFHAGAAPRAVPPARRAVPAAPAVAGAAGTAALDTANELRAAGGLRATARQARLQQRRPKERTRRGHRRQGPVVCAGGGCRAADDEAVTGLDLGSRDSRLGQRRGLELMRRGPSILWSRGCRKPVKPGNQQAAGFPAPPSPPCAHDVVRRRHQHLVGVHLVAQHAQHDAVGEAVRQLSKPGGRAGGRAGGREGGRAGGRGQ